MINLIDFILHVDTYLQLIIQQYSTLSYWILFFIIFIETGFVITPFLPGDSLLFAGGAFAAAGVLNLAIVFFGVFIAAVLGDTVNYHIGKFIGPKVFHKEKSLFFNRNYLLKAQSFYEKYGKKTIIIARFVPIIRTFAPFVAGIGKMRYGTFLIYNVIGGFLWSSLFVFGGYLFGNIPLVKDNFNLIILGIIFISLIPLIKELIAYLAKKYAR